MVLVWAIIMTFDWKTRITVSVYMLAQCNRDAACTDKVKKELLDSAADQRDRARLLASQAAHSADWMYMHVLPISTLAEFKDCQTDRTRRDADTVVSWPLPGLRHHCSGHPGSPDNKIRRRNSSQVQSITQRLTRRQNAMTSCMTIQHYSSCFRNIGGLEWQSALKFGNKILGKRTSTEVTGEQLQ